MKKLSGIIALALALSGALAGLIAGPAAAHDEKSHAAMAKMAATPETAEIKLFATLGTHGHKISTKSPEAQAYFDQGVRLLFNFNHQSAIRSFEAALKRDPDCAMCWWGIAFAYGPNINVPMVPDAAAPAFEAAQKAVALLPSATPAEQGYITAVAARYAAKPPADRKPLDQAFAVEMRKLAVAEPDDADAQVFAAEALMDLQPWDYWQPDGKTPKGNAAEIVNLLERTLARWPDHPGALHLYIHAVEASTTPERAEAAADKLLPLMPGAGHITHMPSHIYQRVGRYEDAVRSNQAAVKADETFFKAAGRTGIYPVVYFNHNVHFIWSAASMEGRSKVAIAAAKRLSSGIKPELVKELAIAELFVPVELEALVQFGRWRAILARPAPPKEQRFATAFWHYAHGFAYAAKGQRNQAKADLAALEAAKNDPAYGPMKGFGVPADQLVEIAATLLSGEIARREGRLDDAIKQFETAVAQQRKVPYTEPPYWYYPTQHTLGAALLEAKRYAEAETVYRDCLADYRDDGWALYGLWKALDRQGKIADAKKTKRLFDLSWANADVRLFSSRF